MPRIGGGAGFFAMNKLDDFTTSDTRKIQIALEALRQTELQLEDFISLANNADQRAMALTTSNIAIATVLAAIAQQLPSTFFAYICCGLYIVLASLSASTSLPRRFHVRGHYWRDWEGHITEGDSYYDAISAQAAENDIRLDENFASMERVGERHRKILKAIPYPLFLCLGTQIGSI
ncbi:hypothetical protein [Epibacterium ulvae]|uniref:hypothetical protein n=1 Tax=Epibacterium ulvae TaxID=1156985 RepID=UPI0024927375|nr:hypothetical protein [Epibacterium ulvae]